MTRVIWVSPDPPPPTDVEEVATISPDDPDLVRKVVDLDDAQSMT